MMSNEPLSTEPYKGVHDYYPADWSTLSSVFGTIRGVLGLYGFEEYNASPLERTEVYESKSSEEIVNQQTYTFEDRGGRSVTLRPEMTPTLARMIAAKRRELTFPARWFSIGNRFRYERPQKGRSREFYQADIDIIGLPGAEAETESIAIAHRILRAFGATNEDFIIRVNSRALVNAAGTALGFTAEKVVDYLSLVDRKDKMSAELFEEAREVFRTNGVDPLELIAARSNEVVDAEYAKLTSLIASLQSQGMSNIVFDPTIARGFLYYTGVIFEAYDTNPENPRALLGGGRYDGLVSLFGGESIPAMGFAIGIETLIDFLTTHDLLPEPEPAVDIYIGTPTPEDSLVANAFADTLRASGVRAIVNTKERSLGDQIKEATKRAIPYFIAFGEEESIGNSVRIKILTESREETLLKSTLSDFIKTSKP
jgi:histidyl-tRNA synthetase